VAPSAEAGEAAARAAKGVRTAVSEAPIVGKEGEGGGAAKVAMRTGQPASMEGSRLSGAGEGGRGP